MIKFICMGSTELWGMWSKLQISKWKCMSPPGIEPATHRFPTWRLSPLDHAYSKVEELWLKFEHYLDIWIKSTQVTIYVSNWYSRFVLELTVVQNLHLANLYFILYSLQNFARTYQITINLIHVLSRMLIVFICQDSVRVYTTACQLSAWSNGLGCQPGNLEVSGSIPVGDMYFQFFACFTFFTARRSYENSIKHDHSPVLLVVLDPRYDKSYKTYAF